MDVLCGADGDNILNGNVYTVNEQANKTVEEQKIKNKRKIWK